jgi:AsmA protein
MKNFLKWGAIVVGCLAVVIIAALLIIPMFVDVQKYKPVIENRVAEASGRSFSVGDDLKLSLFPWAGISLSDLQLGNTAGFSEKEFVRVKSFEVRVKLLPLISKKIQIKRFVMDEPRIVLVKNKNGRGNWEQPKQQQAAAAAKKSIPGLPPPAGVGGLPISALTVGNFAIKNGSALWIDHTANTRKEVKDISLILKDVSLDRPVKLKFSAVLDNNPLSLEGTVGPLGNAFQKGVVPLDLSLNALRQLAMRLKGNLENPATTPGVDLDITVDKFSPRELVAALGQTFPVDTTDPKALSSVDFKAHIKADTKRASVSNGVMNLDQSRLTFAATAAQFSLPNLKFDLYLDKINLDRYLPPKSDRPSAEKPPAKGQRKKADYTPLRRLILDGLIRIGQLTISKANIQDVHLQVKAKNGIFNLDPMKLNMYQGKADGKAVLNVARDIPRSSLNLKIDNVQVEPLLKDVLEKDILQGSTQADINLSMSGDTPERIKKTLNGKGYLKFNDGAIVGIDLAAMVRNVGSAFGLAQKGSERPKTDFTALNIPYVIKNGAVNTPQSSLKSPFIRIIATGTADLVKETLDFRVEPKAVASIQGQGDDAQRQGLMVPVVVSGTFAAPKFRPDLSAAAKQQIEKQVLESGEAKKLLEKEEIKPYQKTAKDALKGILGN